MTTRRTAVFVCLGLAIFAALLPCAAVIFTPSCAVSAAVNYATSTRYDGEIDVVPSPLLARITPRHLARASLPPFAA